MLRTSVVLFDNASQVEVPLQEIGNEVECLPWSKNNKKNIGKIIKTFLWLHFLRL